MTQLINDILDTKVSVHYKVSDTCPFMHITLYDFLFKWPNKWKARLDAIKREQYHSERQKELKRGLPVMYIAGIFPGNTAMTSDNVEKLDQIQYSNIIGIDIDAKDNPDIDLAQLRQQLFDWPCTAGVYYSSSGNGLYCIIPVADGRKTKSYMMYIQKLFKQQYNVVTDSQAMDLNRARFLFSTDESDLTQWTKDGDVDVFDLEYIEQEEHKPASPIRVRPSVFKKKEFSQSLIDDDRFCLAAAEMAINKFGMIDAGKNDWLGLISTLLLLGPEGEKLAHRMSMNHQDNYTGAKDVDKAIKYMSRGHSDRSYFTRFFKRCKDELGPKWVAEVKNTYSQQQYMVM